MSSSSLNEPLVLNDTSDNVDRQGKMKPDAAHQFVEMDRQDSDGGDDGDIRGEAITHDHRAVGVVQKRWLVLLIFCGYGLGNQTQYATFSTIVDETKSYFSCSSAQVNALTAVFPVTYVLLVFPGCALYEKIGMRNGLLVGTGLSFAGSVFKMFASSSPQYTLLFIGQFLNALSQVLWQAIPPLIAATWFPESERTLASAFGVLAGFLGLAGGSFYSPLVLDSNADGDHFASLMGSQMALCFIVFVGVILFVDDAPALRPSKTAAAVAHTHSQIFPVLKKQLKDRNLLNLCVSFGMSNGIFTGLGAVLSQVLEPFDVSEQQTGLMILIGLLTGCVMCGVVAHMIDTSRRYKKIFLILFWSSSVLTLITTLLMKVLHGSLVIEAYIVVILIQAVQLPTMPVVLELVVEMSYPDPEEVACSLAMLSMALFTFVGIGVYSVLLGDNPTRDEAFAAMVFTALAGLATAFSATRVVEHRHRFDAEHHKAANLLDTTEHRSDTAQA